MADCTTHFAHWSVWIQTVSNEFTLVINVTKTSPKTCNIENANWVTLHNLIHINRLSWPTHLVDCQTLQLGHCRMTLHKGGHVHINGGILPAIHDLLLGYISGFFTQHGRVKPWICIIRCILKKNKKYEHNWWLKTWWFTIWLVVSTHLKNMLVKLDHFPNFRGENKQILK